MRSATSGVVDSINPFGTDQTARELGAATLDKITSHESYQAGQALGDAAIDKGVDALTSSPATDTEFQVIDEKGHVVETTTAEEFAAEGLSTASIMRTVRLLGGAMIGIAVLVVVLNQVFSLDTISNGSGPFSGITDSLQSTGVAAMSLLVVGLLVVAANRVMGFFGGGGGM